jgi:hypothetical protein
MPQSVLAALLTSFREECRWLLSQAAAYETGKVRHVVEVDGAAVDKSAEFAIDLRHRAGNLEGLIQAYERLSVKVY